ncbi:MAG: VWA domain-containing protein, partial [Candidatus Dadabacteria bacterium]
NERKAELEEALAKSANLRKSLEAYKKIVWLEEKIANESYQLDERFVTAVMTKIRNSKKPLRRFIMKIKKPSTKLVTGVGSLAVVVLCLSIFYTFDFKGVLKNVKVPISKTKTKSKKQQNKLSLLNKKALANRSRTKLEKHSQAKDKFQAGMQQQIAPQIVYKATSSPSGRSNPKNQVGLNAEFELEYSAGKYDLTRGPFNPSDSPIEIVPNSENTVLPYPEANRLVPSFLSKERYYQVSENGPKLTMSQPVSTFSIDVDTGSYTNARRFLKAGTLPPPESVRIEEFINYFKYDYPVSDSNPFSVYFEAGPAKGLDGKYLLRIGISTKKLHKEEQRKPWNLVFLIDVSGSMRATNKLPLLKRSLKVLVNNMQAEDSVSIVTYAGSSTVVLEPTSGKEKEKIIKAIDSLYASGATYGQKGIETAYKVAKKSFKKDGINRVILATDGDFNVGLTSREELVKFIERKRKLGITLTTLGFGDGNINEAIMEQLADKGNGNYFYIDSFQEARKVFSDDLFSTIETVAKDVKVQIEFNPVNVIQYRLVGYENRSLSKADFANDRVDGGEIGAGHTVTVLYELVLSGTEAAKRAQQEYRYIKENKSARKIVPSFKDELAYLKIRYKKPNGSKSILMSFPLKKQHVIRSRDKLSTDFKFIEAVSAFAHKLRKSKFAPNLTYAEIAKLAKNNLGKDEYGYRREFIQLVKNAAAIEEDE